MRRICRPRPQLYRYTIHHTHTVLSPARAARRPQRLRVATGSSPTSCILPLPIAYVSRGRGAEGARARIATGCHNNKHAPFAIPTLRLTFLGSPQPTLLFSTFLPPKSSSTHNNKLVFTSSLILNSSFTSHFSPTPSSSRDQHHSPRDGTLQDREGE